MNDHIRQLLGRLESPFLYDGLNGINSVDGARSCAILLLGAIAEEHAKEYARLHGEERAFEYGIAVAKWIFYGLGRRPSKKRLRDWEKYALLGRLDWMKPKPNVKQLARELAAEKEKERARKQKRPARRDLVQERIRRDYVKFERHINRLTAARREAIKKNQWYGPYPPDYREG